MNRRELIGAALATSLLPLGSEREEPTQRGSPRSAGNHAQGDLIVVEGLFAGAIRDSHLKGMQQGGVHCGVAGGPSDMASYAGLLKYFDARKDQVVLARSVAEIEAAKRAGRIANVFCWQAADTLGSSFNSPLGSSGTTLRAFQEIGLRIIGLCYNTTNPFGAGCLEPQIGLTRAGRRLVEEIHKLRLVLDVGGHTGEQTTLDAIAMTRGVPVV